MHKYILRILPIFTNGIRSIVTPMLSMLFAFIIIHYFSKELWGEFINILLFVYIATLIFNWGNKEFLIRSFSKNPKEIVINWQNLFISRLPFLGLSLIYCLLFFKFNISIWLCVWLVSSYMFHSFIAVLIYNRNYTKAVIIDLVGFGLLIALIFLNISKMTIELLVQYYAIHCFLKAFLFSLLYYGFFKFKSFNFKPPLLISSFTFFLMGIAGFLQSRIDVYVLASLDDVIALGEYQVISSLFVFSQTIPAILIMPYLKNIYRVKNKSLVRIRNLMAFAGIFINTVAVLFVFYILKYFFDIELDFYQIIAGFMIGYPSYIYAIYVFNFFKHKIEIKVLKVSVACTIINLLLSLFLVHLGYNITGLLFANALAQITCLIMYTQYKINAKNT